MNNNEKKEDLEIKVVIGDDSVLNISEVGDYMNDLKPKTSEKKNKQIIIPKVKKKDEKKDEKKNN